MVNDYLQQQAKEIMEGKASVKVMGYDMVTYPTTFTLYKDETGIYCKDKESDNGKFYIEDWRCDSSYRLVAVDDIEDVD